jgi:hypothetical protein
MRVFLSADLVGSTALKQTKSKQTRTEDTVDPLNPPWLSSFLGFYSVFPPTFLSLWDNYASRLDKFLGSEHTPEFWKANGDELIFTKIVGSDKDLAAVVCCWVSAVREYRSILRKAHSPLDIKASAWTAGFPIRNREVVIQVSGEHESTDLMKDPEANSLQKLIQWYNSEDHEKRRFVRDFVGPSLDIGFRVSNLASPRKMTITPEIALIVSLINDQEFGVQDKSLWAIEVKYFGSVPLKGVHSGKPFPVFWIDTTKNRDIDHFEDKLNPIPIYNNLDIKNFLERFFDENSQSIMRPFIYAYGQEQFGKMGAEYKDQLERYINQCKQVISTDNIEGKALEGDDINQTDDVERQYGADETENVVKSLLDLLANRMTPGPHFRPNDATSPPPTPPGSPTPPAGA